MIAKIRKWLIIGLGTVSMAALALCSVQRSHIQKYKQTVVELRQVNAENVATISSLQRDSEINARLRKQLQAKLDDVTERYNAVNIETLIPQTDAECLSREHDPALGELFKH